MPSITLEIKPGSDRSRRILSALNDRHKLSKRDMAKRHKKWKENEEKLLAYLPEREVDATRRLEREGGKPQYTTLVLPYTYAMVMTAHTYWTTVFLGRSPVFQFTGRHGEGQQRVQAMEALIDYQVQVGRMLVPLYIWLLDVGKYGVGIVNCTWAEEEEIISEINEVDELVLGVIPTGRKKKRRQVRRIPGYHGNKLLNVRPYDWFPDPRVPLNRFQDGEFCGVYGEVGWNEILKRKQLGYYTNLDELKRKSRGVATEEHRDAGSGELELPEISVDLENPETTLRNEGPSEANFHALYDYVVELVPREWGVGKTDMPEKWHFTVDENFSVIVGARPLGAIHNKFPFHIMEFEPEGYALHSRGMPEVLDPVQRTMDWLINSHFYNVRKALNHQVVVDPSRIVLKDLLDPQPGNLVRLSPEAYGTQPSQAIHQLNFFDATQAHIGDLSVMHEFGQRFVGVTDQLMGLLNQGGRKSATEVRTGASFGVNRQKTNAEFYSAMGWSPLSQMMVQNSQQWYDRDQKLRAVGDLMLEAGPQFLDVTPELIQGFYDFVPVDGTLPVDRFAQANLWQQLMGQIVRIPQIAQTYDLGRIFGWVATLAGLKNIHQFRIQVLPDSVAQQQADRGNLVPLPTSASPEPAPAAQVPNVGAAG